MKKNPRPTQRPTILDLALSLCISIPGFACVSTEKKPEVKPPVQTHYTLESGAIEPQVAPLPDYFPIFVNIFAGEQLLARRLAFRGWDFDKDGKIDMLEKLNAQGQVFEQAFDWDRDGRVDELTLSSQNLMH